MEYRGLLINWWSELKTPAKAQRRKGRCGSYYYLIVASFHGAGLLAPFFASLRLCGILFLLAVLSVPTSAQPRRAMAPADVVRVANVTDAQVSPNGQLVVYTVSSVADDKTVSTLWLARVLPEVTPIQPTAQPTPRSPTQRTVPYFEWPEIRSAPRLLLPSGWSASTPRWSPDGNSIAFLSGQEEQDGLWVIRLDRPEPRFIAPIISTNFFITYAGE